MDGRGSCTRTSIKQPGLAPRIALWSSRTRFCERAANIAAGSRFLMSVASEPEVPVGLFVNFSCSIPTVWIAWSQNGEFGMFPLKSPTFSQPTVVAFFLSMKSLSCSFCTKLIHVSAKRPLKSGKVILVCKVMRFWFQSSKEAPRNECSLLFAAASFGYENLHRTVCVGEKQK